MLDYVNLLPTVLIFSFSFFCLYLCGISKSCEIHPGFSYIPAGLASTHLFINIVHWLFFFVCITISNMGSFSLTKLNPQIPSWLNLSRVLSLACKHFILEEPWTKVLHPIMFVLKVANHLGWSPNSLCNEWSLLPFNFSFPIHSLYTQKEIHIIFNPQWF